MDMTKITPQRRSITAFGWLWRSVAAVLALLLAAYVILYVTKGRFLKHPFERYASSTAGRAVTVGGDFQLYLNPHVKFLAQDLAIANPDWARDDMLFKARLIDLELGFWRLLFGEQHYRYVRLDQGAFGLERDKAGRVSWSFDPTKPLEIPNIDRAAITGTKLHYRDDLRRIDLNVTIGDVAATAAQGKGRVAAPLTFSGSGTAMAAPFTLRGALTTPNETLAGGRTGLDLHVGVADSKIDVAGTLPGATRLDGADLKLTASGRNLQTPFALLGIVVPATRPYRISADLTKSGTEFRFTHIAGRFGDSDIAGKLTIARKAARLRLDGVLSSQTLDILDVGPWLGYSPAAIDAKGGKGLITVKGGRPTVLPDAPLAIDGIAGFDAHIVYTAARVRTGNAPITKLETDLTLDDRKLTLAPIAFDLSGGRLTSTITLNARVKPVVTDYDIRLSQVGLGRLLTSFDVENSGTTATMRGRLQLRGYGDTVHKSLASSNGRIALVFPSGTLWVRNIQLAKLDLQNFIAAFFKGKLKKPTSIRCGLIAFTVKDGIATADPIFFDTNRAIFRGKGQFNFADESLRLAVEGDSKEFSLFSGQSPIAIGGYFAAPTINPISKELVGRALAGVALGVALTPLAAILAFVDFGEEKNTDCTAILAAKRSAAVNAADRAAEKR
jgi:uncharacterized protein involved in outer membrane biogenesis